MKQKLSLIICIAIAILSLSACKDKKPSTDIKSPSPSATASAKPDKTEKNSKQEADIISNTSDPTATSKPENERKSQKYVDIIKSGKFYMETRVQGDDGTASMSMAKNGSEMAMSATLANGEQAGMITRGGKNYIIDHKNKVIMITSKTTSDNKVSKLDADGITYIKSGTGKFAGKTLPYDEYKSTSGALTRFYLNGSALAGIEAINNDKSEIFDVTRLTAGFPKEMFVLPDGYQQFDVDNAE